ncbi:MAG: hypothetical protein RLW62_20060 [Gammaproteobacteria bacterium]
MSYLPAAQWRANHLPHATESSKRGGPLMLPKMIRQVLVIMESGVKF